MIPSFGQLSIEQGPIPLWVADPLFYEVNQAYVFPLPDLTEGDVLSINRAMVAWDVKFQNQFIPMFSIIENGIFSEISILDSSLTTYWQNFASEILFIGTTFNTTFLRWVSPDHISFSIDIPGFSQNHSAIFNPNEAVWEVTFQNSTGTYLLVWDGISAEINRFDAIVIDSWQIFRLIYDPSDKGTYLISNENKTKVPFSAKNQKIFSLGIIEDFPFVDLAIFDFETNSYFRVAYNQTFNLSEIDIASVQRNIFPSTYFVTESKIAYSINGSEWIEKIELSNHPSSMGSLTPTLIITTFLSDGVYYQFFGSDFDGDYLPDEIEVLFESSPISADTDGDGLSDLFEYAYKFNPNSNDASLDTDGDGLTNLEEFQLNLDPKRSDTDWGGANDGWEIENSFDPLNRFDDIEDTDSDDLPNYLENRAGTDPRNPDTDSDGLPDSWEYYNGLNPLNPNDANLDYDFDGLANVEEFQQNRHPYLPDNPFPVEKYIIVFLFTFIPVSIPVYLFLKRINFQISDSKMG